MRKTEMKRIISGVLAVVLVLGNFPVTAWAVEDNTGLCDHHTVHENCGYQKAVEGSPCKHEHDGTCGYVEAVAGTPCTHDHDGVCGYAEPVAATPCNHSHDESCGYSEEEGTACSHGHDENCGYSEGSTGSACTHGHNETCGYSEGVAGVACGHSHDSVCGYVQAVEGSACNYVCEACNAEPEPTTEPTTEPTETPVQIIDQWTWVGADELVDGELALPGASAENVASFDDIVSLLPYAVNTEYGELTITWNCGVYPEAGAYEGTYTFVANLPDGYELSDDVAVPDVPVILGDAQIYDGHTNMLGDKASWEFDEGTLFIFGEGPITEFDSSIDCPWWDIRSSIHTVIVEEGISNIPNYAFRLCENVVSITIPNSVERIGEYAFSNCSSLTNIDLPDSVTSIGSCAFYGCLNLTSFVIPSNVTIIKSQTFYNCNNLEYIIIPEGVNTIESQAFARCFGLDFVYIPSTVKNISGNNSDYASNTRPFDCCSSNLVLLCNASAKFTGWSNYWNYCSSSEALSVYFNCSAQDGSFWSTVNRNAASISVPDGVTVIPRKAFYNCTNLEEISLPDSVEIIDDSAFYNCSMLQEISLPNGITKIESYTFYDCYQLKRISIPSTVALIGECAFGYCRSLTWICIPSPVTRILASTASCSPFYGCSSSLNVFCEADTEPGGWGAYWNYYSSYTPTLSVFFGCNLKDSAYWSTLDRSQSELVIPDGITQIIDGAFEDCINLTSITIPDSVVSIGQYAFDGCIGLKNIEIPDSILSIGKGAFRNCDGLTSIQIPYSIATIEEASFGSCDNLEKIILSNSVATIKRHAFWGCTKLKTIYIPNSVCSIPTYYGSDSPFYLCSSDLIIFCEAGSQPDGWSQGWNCRQDGGALSTNFGYTREEMRYWESFDQETDSITLIEGITRIPDGIFRNFNKLKTVRIPDSVTYIGSNAFENCVELETIYIPSSVLNIPAKEVRCSPFYKCSSNLTIYCGAQSRHTGWAEYWAMCDTLKHCQVKYKYNRVEYEFWVSLDNTTTSVTVPVGVSFIPNDSFADCENLKEIIFVGDAPTFDLYTFSEVDAIVYYPAKNKTWTAEILKNYNGRIVWVASCFNDHAEVIDASSAPTCTESGLTEGKHCSACGTLIVKQEVIPAGHRVVNGVCTNCGIYGTCGEGLTWTFDVSTRKLTIIGSGKMVDYEISAETPWASYRTSIKTIELPDGLTRIGECAFEEMTVLESITVPNAVGSIGEYAFYGCTKLKTVDLGDGCSLGESAFWNCPVENLELGASASFGWNVFNSAGLTSITISADSPSFEDSSFWNCVNLKEVHFTGSAPSRVEGKTVGTETSVASFRDVTWYYDCSKSGWTTSNRYNAANKTWAGYTLASENHVEVAAPGMEATCTQDGLTDGKKCSACGTVTVEQEVIPAGHDVVDGICTKCNAYGTCGQNVEWTFAAETGTLTISGTGEMTSSPWLESNSDKIKSVIIEDGVASICDEAFFGCINLNSIEIPDTVTSIGDSAFLGNISLTSIVIPNGVTRIEDNTFNNCMNLSQITIPDSIAYVGRDAFGSAGGVPENLRFNTYSNARYLGNDSNPYVVLVFGTDSNITSCEIHPNTKVIYQNAFRFYSNLTSITIPVGVTQIGAAAFCGTNLQSVEIPDGITTLEWAVFGGCNNLKNVKIPESITNIDAEAFSGCASLTTIIIPKSVTDIGGWAFAFCEKLSTIHFLENAPTFGGEPADGDPTLVGQPFEGVTATAYYPADNTTWTEDKFQNYGGNITWTALIDGNDIILGTGELADAKSAWINGVEYPITSDGENVYVQLPDGVVPNNLVIYGYHTGDPNDVHTQYPTSMKVWALEKQEDGTYKATRVQQLDDILQYAGSSIRITGKKGIRMITSVPRAKKDAMISGNLAGYRLMEYGTVLAWASDLAGGNPLVLGQSYAKSNFAYKRGVADPVFAYTEDLIQYTNVLVGFTNEQCKDDIAMRSYMILENEKGEQVTLYGGIVYRSIGYIAYQNRNAFQPKSAAYEYVWDIIHYVYGNKYDAEYKK